MSQTYWLPRMLNQQTFALAWLTDNDEPVQVGNLVQATAVEFDGFTDGKNEIESVFEEAFLTQLNILVKRDFVERDGSDRVSLTEEGRKAGEEILRRTRDGLVLEEFDTV